MSYPTYRLVVIGVGLLLALGGWYLIERTRVGSLVQASVADPQMVGALGVNTTYLVTGVRSEEHTSELQSLMRISYAVFCLKKTRNTSTCFNKTKQTT